MTKDLSAKAAAEKTEKILDVHKILDKKYPDTKSDLLEPRSEKPVDVLVATILSQATNDILSERAFLALKKSYPSWEETLFVEQKELEKILSVGGLQRQKSLKIKAALSRIKQDFGSIDLSFLKYVEPQKREKYLLGLPGVGPKTAACVLLFGLGIPAFPVDTHVHRISKRLGLIDNENPAKAQKVLEGLVPPEIKKSLHLLMIRHGRERCYARRPRCEDCDLKLHCASYKKKETA